jgi:hypothetical protein
MEIESITVLERVRRQVDNPYRNPPTLLSKETEMVNGLNEFKQMFV